MRGAGREQKPLLDSCNLSGKNTQRRPLRQNHAVCNWIELTRRPVRNLIELKPGLVQTHLAGPAQFLYYILTPTQKSGQTLKFFHFFESEVGMPLRAFFSQRERQPYSDRRPLTLIGPNMRAEGREDPSGKKYSPMFHPRIMFLMCALGRQISFIHDDLRQLLLSSQVQCLAGYYQISNTRSLGALRAPTSRLRPFGPALDPSGLLDNVLHALRSLRPCDPRNQFHLMVMVTILLYQSNVAVRIQSIPSTGPKRGNAGEPEIPCTRVFCDEEEEEKLGILELDVHLLHNNYRCGVQLLLTTPI